MIRSALYTVSLCWFVGGNHWAFAGGRMYTCLIMDPWEAGLPALSRERGQPGGDHGASAHPPPPVSGLYSARSQVAIARETREILCADLSRNHTARALAERFQVSETSLKNYFRGVFGDNLTTFLRESRMRRAAELLRDTELRVAEIAAQVGYENQSKFAAVFARQFGCPPVEYRRRARLH